MIREEKKKTDRSLLLGDPCYNAGARKLLRSQMRD